MIYREYEVIVQELYGSVTENEYTVYGKDNKSFWRGASKFGVVYANTEIGAVQGSMNLIDTGINNAYPV